MNTLCSGYCIVCLNITKKHCFRRTYQTPRRHSLFMSEPTTGFHPPLTLTTHFPTPSVNIIFLSPPPSYKWPFAGCFRPVINLAYLVSPILMTFPAHLCLRFRCPNEGRCPVYMSMFFVSLNGQCHLSDP